MSSNASLPDAHGAGIVTGLRDVSGILPRRELDDLMTNDPDVFNLYILALDKLQKADVDDKMGYFRIAGIHGFPRSDWDGVKVPGAEGSGSYCTHGSYLFPSWHRPYLAMMEQTLYVYITSIAEEFSDPKYKEAAKRFRLPYWDWIKPRAHRSTYFPGQGGNGETVSFPYNFDLPEVLTRAELKVYKPGRDESRLVDIDNPFLTYYFPARGGLPAKDWEMLDASDSKAKEAKLHVSRFRTVRNPWVISEKDDFKGINKTLNMLRESSVEQALDLMSPKYDNYLDFAAEKPRLKRDERGRVLRDKNYKPFVDGPHGSLEDLHNTYHDIIGGTGHMGRVPVAAFDPIFFLHHCNIDRILAVWQATHDGPDAYLPTGSKHTLKDGTAGYGRDVPLWPFRSGPMKDDFWTSAMTKHTENFGYTYDDLEGDRYDVLHRWNSNYRWSLGSNDLLHPPERMKPVNVSTSQALGGGEASAIPNLVNSSPAMHESQVEGLSPAPTPGRREPKVEDFVASLQRVGNVELVVQWYIDLQVERDALNGSFTIFFFIGDAASMAAADADWANYSTSPILAGLTKIFTAPRETCGSCGRDAAKSAVVTGTNAITPKLRDYVSTGMLEGLDAEYVVRFLKRYLHWGVVDVNKQRHKPESVPGLCVGKLS